jgi:hypothetical protein
LSGTSRFVVRKLRIFGRTTLLIQFTLFWPLNKLAGSTAALP